jgi:diketogulonate reductase-like aldo/keto reductase
MKSLMSIHQGYVPLPKSATRERILSNKEVYDFELSEIEMDKLYSLDECESQHSMCDVINAVADLVTDWDVVDVD